MGVSVATHASRGARQVVPGRARGRAERGAFTAELAVALPTLFFLVGWGLLGIGFADASLRCDDAARAGARAAARGEPVPAVEAASKRAAPRGAQVEVVRSDTMVEVRCTARVRVAGLRTFQVHARAVAAAEGAATAELGAGGPGRGANQ